MANFQLVDRETSFLLSPSVDEWLLKGHLARFVVEVTDQLDISSIERVYNNSGSDAYRPRMLLALLFYSYATGTFFSCKIEKASYESVPTRYVAGNQHPDHDTICTFRRRFLEPIGELFTQILLVVAEMDMVEFGDISIDGTKVNANASKHKAMSWDWARELEDQLSEGVGELLVAAEQADQAGKESETLPVELECRQDRLEKIRKAQAQIVKRAETHYEEERAEYDERMAERAEKEQRTRKNIPGRQPKPPEPAPTGKDQVNLTDSESRIMPTSENGWQQAYNAQAAIDMSSHLIVDGHLSQAPNDKQQLEPALDTLDAFPETIGSPENIVADNGYYSEDNVNEIADRKMSPYVATGRPEPNPRWNERRADPGPPPEDPSPVEVMAWRLGTPEGKDFYAQRKAVVETVSGIIKQVLGFRQFSLRGLRKAAGECGSWSSAPTI